VSRLDEMAEYVDALIEIADAAPDRIEYVRNLAETNIAQASEIGTSVIEQLNAQVCDDADKCMEAARKLQAAIAALARSVQSAGGSVAGST